MHSAKPVQAILFVLLMGPLVWVSNKLNWGPTGTFMCVVLAIVVGFILFTSGKKISRGTRRMLTGATRGAAADFMFAPTAPGSHKQHLVRIQQEVTSQVGQRNAPTHQGGPRLPHPAKRPGSGYDPAASARPERYLSSSPTPLTPQRSVRPAGDTSVAGMVAGRNKEPVLELGPESKMLLQTSLTSALVVEAARRKPIAPVFVEEWMRLGLGLLIFDVHNEYHAYLDQMSEGFGFLAGSAAYQDTLQSHQVSRLMIMESSSDALRLGQAIVEESLQIIFSISSYEDGTTAGTYMLALLGGIERAARQANTKPCAILLTDTRWFTPTDEIDCAIDNQALAQSFYDTLLNMLEHAGRPTLPRLAVYLATPSIAGMEEEAMDTCRVWLANCLHDDQEVDRVVRHLEMTKEDAEQLADGDVLLVDTAHSRDQIAFVQLRRASITLKKPPVLPSQEQGQLDTPGELSGLETIRESEQA